MEFICSFLSLITHIGARMIVSVDVLSNTDIRCIQNDSLGYMLARLSMSYKNDTYLSECVKQR